MIKKENEFVGRIRELDDLINRLNGKQSVSVVGERRIGKSSLLYHLFLTGNKRLDDEKKEKYQFVYVDLQNVTVKTPQFFVEKILSNLSLEYNKKAVVDNPLVVFSETLEKSAGNGKHPVLLIDEFEEIVEQQELFNDDFIDTLRSIANAGYLSFVISSRKTLRDITDSGNLTSPFWNIFATILLKEFAFENKLNESAIFLEQYWKELNITEFEKKFLLWYPTNHPLKLQIMCYWLFQNRKSNYDDYDLRKKIEEKIGNFFRSDLKKIEKFFRREIPKLPDKINWTSEFIGKQFKNLGFDIKEIL
jgi:hypothetical protein